MVTLKMLKKAERFPVLKVHCLLPAPTQIKVFSQPQLKGPEFQKVTTCFL